MRWVFMVFMLVQSGVAFGNRPIPPKTAGWDVCPVKGVKGQILVPEWQPKLAEGKRFTIWYASCTQVIRDRKGRVISKTIFEKPHFLRWLVGRGVVRNGQFMATKLFVQELPTRLQSSSLSESPLYLVIANIDLKINGSIFIPSPGTVPRPRR